MFLLKKVASAVLVLWLVSLLVFIATQVLPGDAAQAILGKDATPERLSALRSQLGLDHGVVYRYFDYYGHLLRGNLGESVSNQTVASLIGPRLGNSLVLMAVASVFTFPIAVVLGVLAANRPGGRLDQVVSLVSLTLVAVPEFVVGIILVVLFATTVFTMLPSISYLPPGVNALSQPQALILPALTLFFAAAPYVTRMTRAVMIDVLDSDYIEMATFKGASRRRVLFRHALPNAIGPVAQVIALNMAWMAGGVVVVETVFGFPGIGSELISAVKTRDVNLIQALTIFIAALYVMVNLVSEAVVVYASPRARSQKS